MTVNVIALERIKRLIEAIESLMPDYKEAIAFSRLEAVDLPSYEDELIPISSHKISDWIVELKAVIPNEEILSKLHAGNFNVLWIRPHKNGYKVRLDDKTDMRQDDLEKRLKKQGLFLWAFSSNPPYMIVREDEQVMSLP